MSGLRWALVLCVLAGLGLTLIPWASERGAQDAQGVRAPTMAVSPPDNPHLSVSEAPVATLAPVPPPTPSYNYVWGPNNPYQCFNPTDPNLPANAPRCPPRAVPPTSSGPIVICASGYAAVLINGQVQCAKLAH